MSKSHLFAYYYQRSTGMHIRINFQSLYVRAALRRHVRFMSPSKDYRHPSFYLDNFPELEETSFLKFNKNA